MASVCLYKRSLCHFVEPPADWKLKVTCQPNLLSYLPDLHPC